MVNFSFLSGKEVLVTGASGVIGYNLVQSLVKAGAIVSAVFRTKRGKPFDFQGVNVILFDVCDSWQLSNLPRYDAVFHLAGFGQPKLFTQDKLKTFALNTTPVSILMSKVKDGGYFLFMSSSEVYGSGSNHQEADPIQFADSNRSCYVLGKLAGEFLAQNHQERGINVKSIRICLAYGEGFTKDDTRVLTELIFKGLKNKKVSLMDDGAALRKYIYVEDALGMISNIMRDGSYQLYNVGGTDSISIKTLAESIARHTSSEVEFGPAYNSLIGSPNEAGVNIQRYLNEFPSPEFTTIDDGVEKCARWAKLL